MTENLKIILVLAILFCGAFATKAQVQTMIVSQFNKVEIDTEGDLSYFDLYVGFSNDYQDTIRVISLSSFDSAFSAKIGDSIRFVVRKFPPEAKRNLQPVADHFFPTGDTNYLHVQVRAICVELFIDDYYPSNKGTIRSCKTQICPLYILNGKAVFSEDPKENKRLKKEYEKANRKRKNGA